MVVPLACYTVESMILECMSAKLLKPVGNLAIAMS